MDVINEVELRDVVFIGATFRAEQSRASL